MNKIYFILAIGLLASLASAHTPEGDYEKLHKAYVAAVDAHEKAFDEASLKERRALRSSHPGKEFWPKFVDLSKTDAQAAIWLISNVRQSPLKSSERTDFKKQLYDRLLDPAAKHGVTLDVLMLLSADGRKLGEEYVEGHLRTILTGQSSRTIHAIATAKLGQLLSASDDEKRAAEGKEMLEEYHSQFIGEGAQAIDFTGATIDGHEFSLSDYKGKVVLVDFYGFW